MVRDRYGNCRRGITSRYQVYLNHKKTRACQRAINTLADRFQDGTRTKINQKKADASEQMKLNLVAKLIAH